MHKKPVFIIQITEERIKIVTCSLGNAQKIEFYGFELDSLVPPVNEKQISEKLASLLKKLEFRNSPVIVSLPRSSVTTRYVKIPSQKTSEIEKIIAFQSSRYLPYPQEELVTGYQLISTDKGGFSHANLIIVHKETINKLLRILEGAGVRDIQVSLSSIGLVNLCSFKKARTEPVILLDLDLPFAEIGIAKDGKLLFSRSFKIPGLENINSLAQEILSSMDAFHKETLQETPKELIITSSGKAIQALSSSLSQKLGVAVSLFDYNELATQVKLLPGIYESGSSFASLLGLALRSVPGSLNLLPQGKKEAVQKEANLKQQLRLAGYIVAIITVFSLGLAKNMDTKTKYLYRLKQELKKIETEAKPLSELERRAQFAKNQLHKKPTVLDLLYEIYQIIPSDIQLINFNYEDSGALSLRGHAQSMNGVLSFVTALEKSHVYGRFNVKVRYATKKNTPLGEVMDFEISCSKKS